MEIIDFGTLVGFADARFGSEALTVSPLARNADNVVCLRVGPGGRIGRHPAVGSQVFAVVEGVAVAVGAEGVEQVLSPGRAAVWAPGEEHETWTEHGFTAMVLEGPELTPSRG